MQVGIKKLVVALESLGYQCQYLDGSLIAKNGATTLMFVEDSKGDAVGTFPSGLIKQINETTDEAVSERFSAKTLEEMGYGDFSPSKDKPTGVDEITGEKLKVKQGDQAVTSEKPNKGPNTPSSPKELPADFTGGSKNNADADVPKTGGGNKTTTVGPNGGSKSGTPGPNTQKPEKTSAMGVGNSLFQPDDGKSGNYKGSKVGSIGGGPGAAGATSKAFSGANPAGLPTTQPAQSLPDIPSPGKGRMSVTKGTIESVLSSFSNVKEDIDVATINAQDEQTAKSNPGKKVYVISRPKSDVQWSVSSVSETMSDKAVQDSRNAASSFLKANPDGGVMVVFSEQPQAQIEQGLADGRNPREMGEASIVQGKVEETIKKFSLSQEQKEKVLESLPKSFGLMKSIHPGPFISRKTFQQIDLNKIEEKLTPIFAQMILEALPPVGDDEEKDSPEGDDSAPPPLPGKGDEAPPSPEGDMPSPPGDESGGGEADEAGMGGPEPPPEEAPDSGELPGDAGGADLEGAPDIGGEPAPQPVGGAGPSPEGAHVPELPDGEGGRWQQAKAMCPDCDDSAIEELVQVGILGDLYNAVTQRVMAKAAAASKSASQPLVASMQPKKGDQDATKLLERSDVHIPAFELEKQLNEAWMDDPMAFVGTVLDGLMSSPGKVSKAARLVLGLKEGDYVEQDVQEAKGILDGLGDSVREVRNKIQEVRLMAVGKIKALTGSKFARGSFASEAEQMSEHLLKIESNMDAFLRALGHYQDEFKQRYGGVEGTPPGGAAPSTEPSGEGPGSSPMGVPSETPAVAPTAGSV